MERAQWVADLQGAASSGDSSAIAFLKLKSKRHAEWSALVEASGGQHQAAHTVQQHFKNVLAHTPLHARDDECKPFLQKLHDDMQQCQPQLITASELCMAVAKLKPGKSSGARGMSNELVRSLSQHPAGAEQLLHLLNNMLVTGSVPQALNLGIACLIPKCVKPIQANQIRPIMLLEVLQKLYAGILMQRLRPHWPPLHAQIGAVPGGQPVEALFAAHSMLELAAVSDEPEPLFLKLDIRGAFDNLRHASVAAYLATLPKHAAYEAERLMRLLLHQTFMFSFFHEEWQLQISNGTPQGGSHSAGLFARTLDHAIARAVHQWEEAGHTPKFPPLWLLLYVDDILLCFKNWGQATCLLPSFLEALNDIGLQINYAKSCVVASPWLLARAPPQHQLGPLQHFQFTHETQYLRQPFGFGVSIETLCQHALKLAHSAWGQLKPILKKCHWTQPWSTLKLVDQYVGVPFFGLHPSSILTSPSSKG